MQDVEAMAEVVVAILVDVFGFGHQPAVDDDHGANVRVDRAGERRAIGQLFADALRFGFSRRCHLSARHHDHECLSERKKQSMNIFFFIHEDLKRNNNMGTQYLCRDGSKVQCSRGETPHLL